MSSVKMEARRELLRSQRVCRFCLTRDEPLTSIYDRSARALNSVPLPLQIMACVAIEAFPSDGMPVTICIICRHFMDQSYRFKQICRQADEALRHSLNNGELRGPIEWPMDMLKSLPPDKIKVEDMEYTDEEIEDDAEEEQIEEEEEAEVTLKSWQSKKVEPQAASTPHPSKIKVMHRGDEIIIQAEEENVEADTEEESPKQSEQSEEVTVAEFEANVSKGGGPIATFSYPCSMCPRSFPLKQLLDIHMKKLHRERTVQCNVCFNKFFSKYDLQKHSTVHSGEKPFECVVCHKRFARHPMLRRHEKVHSEIPLLLCQHCDSSFFSAEELDAHSVVHQRERPHKCKMCPKSFSFKQSLMRHKAVHSEQHPNKCNYCPKSFRTINMLAKHIQSHAGQRPYPCRYCKRSFLLPHHYTRHLRIAHNEESWRSKIANRKGSGSSIEPQILYKCERCDSTFAKQDDLVFHSAIHATKDLTCPLCKDKFDTVDAVTEHITSHAEGSFVCDWCDLMFNSESRLDAHVDEVHGDTLRETSGDADDEDVLCIEGRLVEDEMELKLLHENFKAEDDEPYDEEDEDDDCEESQAGEEEYNEYDIKLTGEDEDGQTLEITSQVKREVEGEFRQKALVKTQSSESYKPPSEERDENAIYTELSTVDTIKIAQEREEELEANRAEKEVSANLTSSILRKAEQVIRQRKIHEELLKKELPLPQKAKPPPPEQRRLVQMQPKQPQEQIKRNSKSDQPTAQIKQSSQPVILKHEILHRPVVLPAKPKQSASQRVMQLLKNSKEFKDLDEMEKLATAVTKTAAVVEQDESTTAFPGAETIAKESAEKKNIKKPSVSQNENRPESEAKKQVEGSQIEENRQNIENDPSIKSSERSLKLLERDLQELKKGSLGSSQRPIQRFPTHQRPFKRHFEKGKHNYKNSEPMHKKKSIHISPSAAGWRFKKPRISVGDSTEKPDHDSLRSSDESDTTRDNDNSKEGDDEPPPRRSGRPSKVKDYAKMISDGLSSDDDEMDESDMSSSDDDEPEYKAPPRASALVSPAQKSKIVMEAATTVKRGRGRPRKIVPEETPPKKVVKTENSADGLPSTPTDEPTNSVPTDTVGSTPADKGTNISTVEAKGTPTLGPGGLPLKRRPGRPSKAEMLLRKQLLIQQKRERKARIKAQQRDQESADMSDAEYEELGDVPKKDVPEKRSRRSRAPAEDSYDSASPSKTNGQSATKVKESSAIQMHRSILEEAKRTISEIGKTLEETRIPSFEGHASKLTPKKAIPVRQPPLIEKVLTPLGQTLRKVPASLIKSLPPGVKPLPLPPNIPKASMAHLPKEALKAVNAGQISEMMIGDRMVKVQKIVMTKAEVDAMAKKGLLEMKDGAMMLKPGYKLSSSGEMRHATPKASQQPSSSIPTNQPMRVEPIDDPPVDDSANDEAAIDDTSEPPQEKAKAMESSPPIGSPPQTEDVNPPQPSAEQPLSEQP